MVGNETLEEHGGRGQQRGETRCRWCAAWAPRPCRTIVDGGQRREETTRRWCAAPWRSSSRSSGPYTRSVSQSRQPTRTAAVPTASMSFPSAALLFLADGDPSPSPIPQQGAGPFSVHVYQEMCECTGECRLGKVESLRSSGSVRNVPSGKG